MLSSDRGFTLLEVVVSSALVALIAGGTMIAFVTALNISHRSSTATEAARLAQQTMERFRNRVACDDPWFDNVATPATLECANQPAMPGAWTADPSSMTREYQIAPEDCDGVNGPGDCFKMDVRVQWTPPS